MASLVLLAISYQDAHPEQRAVDYLIAELERIRGPLMVLSEERFIKIIDLTSTHLETWFKYPQLLPQVLAYLCELRFSTARSLSLSQSLLNAIAHVTASPESIDYLLDLYVHFKAFLIDLPEDKFQLVMLLTNENIETLVKHKQLYPAIVRYMSDPFLSTRRAEMVCRMLIKAANVSATNVNYLNNILMRNWGRLKDLPAVKFDWIIELLDSQVVLLSKYSELLPEILQYLFDPSDVPLPSTHLLADMLLRAADLQEILPGTLAVLMDELTQHREQLMVLDETKYYWVMERMKGNMEEFLEKPLQLSLLLETICEPGITFECSKLLRQTVRHVVDYQSRAGEPTIEHLLRDGVGRFNHTSADQLRILNERLADHPEHTVEPLFDHTTHHLEDQNVLNRAPMKEVIHLFYGAAKRNRGDVDAIFADPVIAGLFSEESDDLAALRKQRIILMHLLHHQVLMTGGVENEALDTHVYQWTDASNQQLLQHGFDWYIQQTQAILGKKPAEVNLDCIRDLNVKQQHALLQLTDDLALIGQVRPGEVLDTQGQVKTLAKDLNQLMNRYGSSWFKSKERKEQLTALQNTVGQALRGHGEFSRYETVLRALNDAKFAAMDSDAEQDQHRWFKMNRSGKSRYFNTLNQMQDKVLRHWVHDLSAVHSFQVYQQVSREAFLTLTHRLLVRVADYDAQTYPPTGDPRNQLLGRRLGQFFSKVEDQNKLQSLNRALRVFADQYDVRDGQLLRSADVDELIKELQDDLSRLPGHLVTLANELLARGDALTRHLAEQEAARAPAEVV